MGQTLPIKYSGFWDFPHAFFVEYEENLYLFWRGYFDDEIDDYPEVYDVYRISGFSFKDAGHIWNLDELTVKELLFQIPIRDVVFDSSRRKFIDSDTFETLIRS
jgi:hypothetical protein